MAPAQAIATTTGSRSKTEKTITTGYTQHDTTRHDPSLQHSACIAVEQRTSVERVMHAPHFVADPVRQPGPGELPSVIGGRWCRVRRVPTQEGDVDESELAVPQRAAQVVALVPAAVRAAVHGQAARRACARARACAPMTCIPAPAARPGGHGILPVPRPGGPWGSISKQSAGAQRNQVGAAPSAANGPPPPPPAPVGVVVGGEAACRQRAVAAAEVRNVQRHVPALEQIPGRLHDTKRAAAAAAQRVLLHLQRVRPGGGGRSHRVPRPQQAQASPPHRWRRLETHRLGFHWEPPTGLTLLPVSGPVGTHQAAAPCACCAVARGSPLITRTHARTHASTQARTHNIGR